MVRGLLQNVLSTFIISEKCCLEEEKDVKIVCGDPNPVMTGCRPIPGWFLNLGRAGGYEKNDG